MRRSAVVIASLLVLGSAAVPAQAATPLKYVAMGDSYSAASGVLPLDPTAAPECARSTNNYPHLLATRLKATLTDVTCGGADTGDYAGSQYEGVAPQYDALRRDTQLVTMTIGGNDSGVFLGAIEACSTAGLSTGGTGSPCQDQNGGRFENTIRQTTYPALVKVLRTVKAKSPSAKVLILGYPWIMPATGGCFPQMPIATGDVPYLRHLQATLNDAVSRAARTAGATYVDMSVASNGHDACQAIGTRWIEPVLGGTNPVIVHPNAFGEQRMADRAAAALRQLG